MVDIILWSVDDSANITLRDPTAIDIPPVGGGAILRMLLGVGL